jgi:PAS domain S-box-containing protein
VTDDEFTAAPVRPRSLLVLGLIGVLLPVAIAVLAALGAERVLLERITESRLRFARALADQLTLEFKLAVDAATSAAGRPGLRASARRSDRAAARTILINMFETPPFYDGLVLLDDANRPIAEVPDGAAADLSRWIAAPPPGARDLRLLEHETNLIVRVPVHDTDGTRLGTLIASVSLPKMLREVSGIRFGETGRATLVHRDGQVLASSDPALLNTTLLAPEMRAQLDAGRDGMLDYYSATAGREQFTAVAHMPGWPLALNLSQARDEAFAPIRYVQRGIALAVAILMLVSALVAWFARRSFLGYEAGLRRGRERMAEYAREIAVTLGLREAILNNAANSIITVDTDGVIRSVNATALRWFGYDESEMVGRMTAFDLLPAEHYEAIRRETAAATGIPVEALRYQDFVARARRGEPQQVERTFLRKDGSTMRVVVSVSALRDSDGNVTGYMGVSTDISALKAAEQAVRESELRFRTLFDNAPIGIYLIDADGALVLTNSWYASVTGRDLERLRHDWESAVHPEDRARVRAAWDTALADRGRFELEFRLRHVDGRTLWAHGLGVPLYDTVGNFTGYMGTTLDVSARKRVEQMKNEFIATVSHELRTPLTSIRGSLGLLAAGVAGALPAQATQLVQIAHSNSERLVRLINDILDIERIEAGRMDFRLEELDLSGVVENAVLANRGYAEPYGVTYALRERPRQVRVKADRDRLLQVLANLMSNAAKYAPRGSVVELAVRIEGPAAQVSVSDSGPGVPEEFRSRIFSKFAQADSSDTRDKGGSGLGLSITKAIVEGHGGRIGYESHPGRTTFWFELPLHGSPGPESVR